MVRNGRNSPNDCRLSTTAMISSTNPSSPISALIVPSDPAAAASFLAVDAAICSLLKAMVGAPVGSGLYQGETKIRNQKIGLGIWGLGFGISPSLPWHGRPSTILPPCLKHERRSTPPPHSRKPANFYPAA